MEMERFNGRANAEDQGAVALDLDLAKALERVRPPCGLGVGDVLQLRGYFEHQRRVQFEGCAAEPLQTISATLPGSKWSPSHHWPMILFQGPRGVWQSSSFLVWPRVAASACIFPKALCC